MFCSTGSTLEGRSMKLKSKHPNKMATCRLLRFTNRSIRMCSVVLSNEQEVKYVAAASIHQQLQQVSLFQPTHTHATSRPKVSEMEWISLPSRQFCCFSRFFPPHYLIWNGRGLMTLRPSTAIQKNICYRLKFLIN